MILTWIFTAMVLLSTVFAALLGNGAALSAAVVHGAQSGITLAVSMAGSICLWSGVGKLTEALGLTQTLSRLLRPLLHRLFPSTKTNAPLASAISGNICANFLGLGNAATPMGMRAVALMKKDERATDEMCRLIVLNTASIQLIPTNVAAVRASLGCASPFDILPTVWLTSLCSVGAGIAAALLFGRVCRK